MLVKSNKTLKVQVKSQKEIKRLDKKFKQLTIDIDSGNNTINITDIKIDKNDKVEGVEKKMRMFLHMAKQFVNSSNNIQKESDKNKYFDMLNESIDNLQGTIEGYTNKKEYDPDYVFNPEDDTYSEDSSDEEYQLCSDNCTCRNIKLKEKF